MTFENETKRNRHLPLIGVCSLSLKTLNSRGGAESRNPDVFYELSNINLMKRKTRRNLVLYSIRMDVEKLVRVKAYKRVRNGKIERVGSHYRKY